MTLKKRIKKWLYGSCPGFAGSFPYCGVRTYFPKGSSIFTRACEQGIYERNISQLLSSLTKPGTFMFDVGANIGLTSIPVLAWGEDKRVVSFEPSANALGYLRRTQAGSGYGDRWRIVGKAAGRAPGTIDFFVSAANLGDFDSMVDTGRSGTRTKQTVEVTTLDLTWDELGRPPVSMIKMDIEGAETEALAGAEKLIRSQKPSIIVEWYEGNLKAYGYDSGSLLKIASDMGYQVLSVPGLVPVDNVPALLAHMVIAEAFLLLPQGPPDM
jgi:FkbM family methyltransferase